MAAVITVRPLVAGAVGLFRAAFLRSAPAALLALALGVGGGPTFAATGTPALPPEHSEYSLSPLPNGMRLLRILSPTVLELTAVVAGSPNTPPDGPIPP